MSKITDYTEVTALNALAVFLTESDGTKKIKGKNLLAALAEISDDVNIHRNTWGGRSLGTSVSADQFAEISAGTFHGMLTGDYWTIGGVDWVIADFDYWLQTGDTETTAHHVVIVPRDCLYNAKMNDTDIVTGAYVGSKMRTDNLANAKTTIETAFGSAHILTYRSNLAAGVNGNFENSHPWTNATVELMNESMVYGTERFHNQMQGTSWAEYHTIDKTQLAVFRLNPVFICAKLNNNRATWWLRDVVNSAAFAVVNHAGGASAGDASSSFGVRPAFGIIA